MGVRGIFRYKARFPWTEFTWITTPEDVERACDILSRVVQQVPSPRAASAKENSMRNVRKTKYVILISFLLIGIGIVIATTATKSVQYYLTVDELLTQRPKFQGHELKVAGIVVANSIQKTSQGMQVSFRVEHGGKDLEVSYRGPVPDAFKDGAEVVVTGILTPGGRFEASHVLAKCASRYKEKLNPGFQPTTSNL